MSLFQRVLICVLWLWLAGAASVQAARLEQPYAVEVPVASQGQADREVAQRAGLLLLAERLTGQRLDQHPAIQSAQRSADRFLMQFSYVQDKTVLLPGQPPSWRIRLVFAQAAVNQLLAEAGLALWPFERPQVLLLVANEQGHLLPQRQADGADPVAGLLRLGQARGVPLRIPDPAAQDVTIAAAVQSLDASALAPQASQLQSDALLLGSVRGSDAAGWNGQWLLQARGSEQRFQARGANFSGLVDAALREAAVHLSGGYRQQATADTGPSSLRLQVDGIASQAAFSALQRYLQSLDAVRQIGDVTISGTTVTLDVDVTGREGFRSLVGLSHQLQWQEEIAAPAGSDPSVRPVWRYRWQP